MRIRKNKKNRYFNRFHYGRYFLVLILFVSSFIFGRNMNVLTLEQKQLQSQVQTQQNVALGIYPINLNREQYAINELFSISSGQCGILFFDLRNTTFKNELNYRFTESPKIKILISNSFNQIQELGVYEIKSDKLVHHEIAEFCANANFSDLILQKEENSRNDSFEISNIIFYPLAIEKHDLSNLTSPIVGNTDFSKIIFQSGIEAKDASKAYKFTRHNQMIGQTFVANSDIISGVDLKLSFSGVGGIGNYYLELREVSGQDGKTSLLPDRIAYFGFNKDSAERYLKTEEGVYHIPLVAHLEKGKTYFVGISNEAVKFNILNTLKIYGSTTGNSQSRIVTSINGKTSSKAGSLYMRVYGADYVKVGEEKVLTGAKILDNGDGTGQYIYEQKGNFSDYLDIDQVISAKNTSVFYNNVQAGISGRDEGDNAFIYKINTIYPFTKMKIDAQQANEAFINALVYYSFDNISWTEIKNDWDKEDSLLQADQNKFSQLIQGDGKTKTVYIKITYDKEDVKEKNIHLFGLKNIKVSARLIIKN